jgi:hypothetical protein
MQRALALLLSLVFVIATAAVPAAVCVRTDMAMADDADGCCELPVPMSPLGPCCVVSAPVRDGVVVNAAPLPSKADHAVAIADHAVWVPSAHPAAHQCGAPRSTAPTAPVPLYLQHLSLLI